MRAQNRFHNAIQSFVCGRANGRVDLALSCLGFRLGRKSRAKVLVDEYEVLRNGSHSDFQLATGVEVQPYAGDNPHVKAVAEQLLKIKEHIILACVHGSLGVGDEVAYSDFDALVIIADSAFADPDTLLRVSSVLQDAQRHMYKFDALQHHGWFVLTENDLSCYCEAYFPVGLFKHAKSILGEDSIQFRVSVRDSTSELIASVLDLIGSIDESQLEAVAGNLYSLKSFMSRIMLLPAMFIQARTGKGVFKKKSFMIIGDYFEEEALFPVRRVSQARRDWRQELSVVDRYLFTRKTSCRSLVSKIRRVNPEAQGQFVLEPTFQRSLTELMVRMRQELAKSEPTQ